MINLILYSFNFFTTWMAIFTVFHKVTNKYVSLSFLSFIVMTMGLYFSFINPAKFVLYDGEKKIEFVGEKKFFLIDAIFHIGVFIFIHQKYGFDSILDQRALAALLLLAVYNLMINAEQIYGVKYEEISKVGVSVFVAYIIIGIMKGIY